MSNETTLAASLIIGQARRLSLAQSYFFFFPGITLATALTIEPATFATTPFFEPRFFARDFDLGFVLRDLGAALDFDFVFFLVAVFAINDCSIPQSFRYSKIKRRRPSDLRPLSTDLSA